jgi:hypothetical protein
MIISVVLFFHIQTSDSRTFGAPVAFHVTTCNKLALVRYLKRLKVNGAQIRDQRHQITQK